MKLFGKTQEHAPPLTGSAAIWALTDEQVAEAAVVLDRKFADLPPWSGLTVKCRGCTTVADPENTTDWAQAIEGQRSGTSVWGGRGPIVYWVNRRCRVCSYKWKERQPDDLKELCEHEGHRWADYGRQVCLRCNWDPAA